MDPTFAFQFGTSSSCHPSLQFIIMSSIFTIHHHVIHLYNSSSCHPSLQFIIMSSIFTIHHHVIHLYNSSSCHPSLQFIIMSSIFTIHHHVIHLYNSSSCHPSFQFIIMSSIFTIHHHVINLYNSSSCHHVLLNPTFNSTDCLKKLHWLPIHNRIIFKIALMTYRTLATSNPPYLQHLILRRHTSGLRSSSTIQLHQPVHKSSLINRGFSHASPAVWNALPPPPK